jgi:hypothetical protein
LPELDHDRPDLEPAIITVRFVTTCIASDTAQETAAALRFMR